MEGCTGNPNAYVYTRLIGTHWIVSQDSLNNPDDTYESERGSKMHGEALLHGQGAQANAVRVADSLSAFAPLGILVARNFGYATTSSNVFFYLTYEYIPATSQTFPASADVDEVIVANRSSGEVLFRRTTVESKEYSFNQICADCGSKTKEFQSIVKPDSSGKFAIDFQYYTSTCWVVNIGIQYQVKPQPVELPSDYKYEIYWPK
jgi:hypothetical protein